MAKHLRKILEISPEMRELFPPSVRCRYRDWSTDEATRQLECFGTSHQFCNICWDVIPKEEGACSQYIVYLRRSSRTIWLQTVTIQYGLWTIASFAFHIAIESRIQAADVWPRWSRFLHAQRVNIYIWTERHTGTQTNLRTGRPTYMHRYAICRV